jgi:hypothetical protein
MFEKVIQLAVSNRRIVHALFVALALLQTVGFAVAGDGGCVGCGP